MMKTLTVSLMLTFGVLLLPHCLPYFSSSVPLYYDLSASIFYLWCPDQIPPLLKSHLNEFIFFKTEILIESYNLCII